MYVYFNSITYDGNLHIPRSWECTGILLDMPRSLYIAKITGTHWNLAGYTKIMEMYWDLAGYAKILGMYWDLAGYAKIMGTYWDLARYAKILGTFWDLGQVVESCWIC